MLLSAAHTGEVELSPQQELAVECGLDFLSTWEQQTHERVSAVGPRDSRYNAEKPRQPFAQSPDKQDGVSSAVEVTANGQAFELLSLMSWREKRGKWKEDGGHATERISKKQKLVVVANSNKKK